MSDAPAPGGTLAFRSRPACPVCDGTEARVQWSGRLDEPELRRLFAQFRYSGDWERQLGDAPFALLRCARCGMMWHREVIAPEWVPVVYGEWADAAQAARFEAADPRLSADPWALGVQRAKLVLRLHHLLEGGPSRPRLLDFGCGDGALLRMAEGFGMVPYGIDVSASRSAALRAAGVPVWPDLAAFDAEAGGPVEAVVLMQVLEHVADPLGLLRALHARLVPGGVLFVAVPDCRGITVPRDFDAFHRVQPVEHPNAFTPDSLTRICRRAGFRPLRRPTAILASRPGPALRAAANWLIAPRSTDQFFRRGD